MAQVDLRGRSRQQSREDILKRARLERERRALEKRRFSAALVIQVLDRQSIGAKTRQSPLFFLSLELHVLLTPCDDRKRTEC